MTRTHTFTAPTVPAKTRQHLEWDRILRRLAEHCRGPVAHARALALTFAETRETLDLRLVRTSEARDLLDGGHGPPIGQPPDVRHAIGAAARGSVLDPEDLAAIGLHLEAAGRCRRYLGGMQDRVPALCDLAERLADLPHLGRQLVDSFDERGQLLDEASGELTQLRGRVEGMRDGLKRQVDGMVADPQFEGLLQDGYFTMRDDRYVLPVRSGAKRQVEGVVHGWSKTGATVFIEPQAVMESNNRLLIARAQVDQEIRRILKRLSKQVGDAARELTHSHEALSAMDLALACGRLSKELEATRPILLETPRVHLKAARHPLLVLAGVDVVPNDLTLAAPQRVLVVTGPNTGGKTVALKTVGLCTLMGLAGLHVPADEGSEIPMVPGVFTDIGDEQSLDAHQSTFSGHIANLMKIMEGMRPGSLVLLDELVVGTDPLQGAALAQAILEDFADHDALVLVTTHYESLKALPFEDARFRNGAVGFDATAHRPTYHLTMDIPGASSALLTARRLGLDPSIVERAAALTGPSQQQLHAVIERLEAETAAAQKIQIEVERDRRRLHLAQVEADALRARLKKRLKDGVDQERDGALKEARQLRDEVARLKKGLKSPEKRRDGAWLQQQQGRATKAISEVMNARAAERASEAGPAPKVGTLKVGQRVFVLSLNAQAELLSLPDAKGRCEVQAGILRAKVKIDDLRKSRAEAVAEGRAGPKPPKASKRHTPEVQQDVYEPPTGDDVDWENAPPQSPDNTLDLRGMRAHEAVEETGRFLDRLVGQERHIAFIIHGHGTGALKREIRSWLRTCHYARTQRPGGRYEGGDGVTAVLLR